MADLLLVSLYIIVAQLLYTYYFKYLLNGYYLQLATTGSCSVAVYQWLLSILVSIAGNKSGDVIMRSTLGGAVQIFQWSVCFSVESTLLVR